MRVYVSPFQVLALLRTHLAFSAGTANQILAAKEKERAKEENGKSRDVSPDRKRRRKRSVTAIPTSTLAPSHPFLSNTGGLRLRLVVTHLRALTRTLQIRIRTRVHPPVQVQTRRIRQGGEGGRFRLEGVAAANRTIQGHGHAAVHRGLARTLLIHAADRTNTILTSPNLHTLLQL